MNEIVKKEKIENMIYEIRGMQVMLDSDLARLYQVETKRINEAVNNNVEKFPERFSWKLTNEEKNVLRSKFSTANISKKSRSNPRVFTEQGIYMIATILKSDVATQVSIAIMDAFVKMRNYFSKEFIYSNILLTHENRILKLEESFNKFSSKELSIIYEGKIYDALSIMLDILNDAKDEIIIVDNYVNKELLDLLRNINKKIIIMSKNITNELIKKYKLQYNNVDFIDSNPFHDRYVILDRKKVYISGMSLKDIGTKYSYINKVNEQIFIDELLERINNILK